MKHCTKYTQKTSYRINDRIKSIMDNAHRDLSKKTGLRLSGGAMSRAFWEAIDRHPDLRKECVNLISKMIREEAGIKRSRIAQWKRRSK